MEAEFFVALMRGLEAFTGIRVLEYVLMSNHFHLLVHCPAGGLPTFMKFVTERFTRSLNPRLGRDGPLFRSRFRAHVVEDPSYRSRAGRYIHRNPIEIGVEPTAYRWSSMRCYTGAVEAPAWLRTGVLLSEFDGDRDAFAAYVMAPL